MPILHHLHSLLFTAPGIGIAVYGLWVLRRAWRSHHWPHASGVITVSAVKTSLDDDGEIGAYMPEIGYRYTVDGKVFAGNLLTFGLANLYASRQFAECYCAKYPVGKRVDVHYEPGDATVSVLETGIFMHSFIPFVLGMVTLALGVWMATLFPPAA